MGSNEVSKEEIPQMEMMMPRIGCTNHTQNVNVRIPETSWDLGDLSSRPGY